MGGLMLNSVLRVLLAMSLGFLSVTSFATTETKVTDDFSAIYRSIQKLSENHNPGDILVAFDIDKTLLLVQDCLPSGESKGFAGWLKMVAKCPADLTEAAVPGYIRELQKKGFHTMALTARAVNLVTATERELERNDIRFNGFPFDSTRDFTESFPKGVNLVFRGGVTYAAGRNKGFILERIQAQQPRPYSLVVFVDDASENIRHMEKTYKDNSQTHVIIFHYNKYE